MLASGPQPVSGLKISVISLAYNSVYSKNWVLKFKPLLFVYNMLKGQYSFQNF